MALNLADLKFKVDKSELDAAKKSLGDVSKELPGVGAGVDSVRSAFDKLKSPVSLAITLFAAAAGGAIKFAMDSINAADALGKMTKSTGMSSTSLQVFSEVVKRADGDLNSFMGMIDKMSGKMVKAKADGTDQFSKSLEYFGVKMRDANGELRDTATIASEVAIAYQGMEKNASTTAAVTEVLGKSYRDNLNTLLELSNQEEIYQKQLAAGAIITDDLIEASDEYNDSLDDLMLVKQGIGNYVAGIFLPLLTGMAKAIFTSATNGGLLQYALDGLGKVMVIVGGALKGMATFLVGLDTGFQLISKSITLTVDLFAALVDWDADAAKAAWSKYTADVVKTSEGANKAIRDLWKTVETKPKVGEGKPALPKTKGNADLLETELPTITVKPDKTLSDLTQKWLDAVDPIRKYRDQLVEVEMLYNKGRLTADEYAIATFGIQDAIDKATGQTGEAYEANQKRLQQLKDERDAYIDLIDPFQQYREELDKAELAYKNGVLSGEEYLLVQEKIQQNIDKEMQKTNESTEKQKDSYASLVQAIEGYTQDMADAFVEFAITGKLSFKDLIGSILEDLARMMVNEAWKSLGKSLGGEGGWSSAISAGIEWVTSLFSTGSTFSNGAPTPFASGTVLSSSTMFPMANGSVGNAGEAGEEGIFPLKRMASGRLGIEASGSGGETNVSSNTVIIENINVKADERTDGNSVGKQIADQIKVIVLQTLNNERRPGNSLNPVASGSSF